jgi:hypothetical protein
MDTNQSTDVLSDFRVLSAGRRAINRDNSMIFEGANESGLRAVTTFDLFIAPLTDKQTI